MIDFPASPVVDQIFQAPNGATYRWNGTIWLSVGAGSSISAGDFPPASPGINQLWFNTTLGALFIWFNDGNTSQWVPANPMPSQPAYTSTLLQTVFFQTGALINGTPIIPLDDTIPQISEGTEFMTCAITPKSALSRLYVTATAYLSSSVVAWITGALFRDSGVNALAAATVYQPVATGSIVMSVPLVTPSNSLAPTTFRFRAGSHTASTTTLGGSGTFRYLGGTWASGIIIQEVL